MRTGKLILDYRIVDAFASRPFQGNPAAVVLEADALTDSQMQQVASEFNLSETVYVLRPAGPHTGTTVRLRWFTPQCEVSFCGHASLAAIHAYCERQAEGDSPAVSQRPVQAREIGVQCAAGYLTVMIGSTPDDARCYWLSMPRPDVRPIDFSADPLLDALGLPRDMKCQVSPHQTRDQDVITLLTDGEQVRTLSPDMIKLERLSRQREIRGICVASTDTGDERVACISRFFAPAAGIAEDPVTGSVHGPLAALLIHGSHVPANRPGQWSFVCRQLPRNGRVGDVHIRAQRRDANLAVEVGGSCVTVMAGRISP